MTTPRFDRINGTWLALGAMALAGAASMTRRGARNTDDPRIELAALEQAGVIMVGGGSVIDAAGVIVIGRWKAFGGKSVRDDPNGFRAEVAEVARSLQGMAGVEWLDRQIGETQAAVDAYGAAGEWGWGQAGSAAPAQTYPDYPFYVVHSSGKVVSGWDYREDANEALAQDREVGFTGLKVFTTSGVKRKYGAIVWDQGPRTGSSTTQWTPSAIHDLADRLGIPWDDDEDFMDLSERSTGKRYLDDMTPTELGVLAAILDRSAGAARHPRDDESELLLPALRPPPPRRDLPVLRQRAELALPDAELARRMLAGDDVLGELTFEQAAVYDPRRVDALISQQIGNAFAQVFGGRPGPMGDDLYLAGVKFARQAHGGALPTAALVSLVQENLDRALFGAWPRLPGPVKAHLRRNLHIFDAGFDGAAQVARQAARVTRGTPDNIEWLRLAAYLEGHKPMLRAALTEALPGPAGGRRRLGPGRRMLPGPRDGDEW